MDNISRAPHSSFVKIEELIPYAMNSRTHSDVQIDRLCSGIMEFGFTNSVLADEQGIVAGHGRVLAARRLYDAGKQLKLPNGQLIPVGTLPVIDVSGWSKAQRKAYIIFDNQSAAMAGWDLEMLKIEVDDLKAEDYNIELTGFTESELDDLFLPEGPNDNGKDPDDVPEVPVEPHAKPGDVWVCGAHRIMCGDSTSSAAWAELMQGEKADITITDPPYNVAFTSKLAGSIKNDDMGDKEFRAFLFSAFKCLYDVMKQGASIYVYHADMEGYNFRGAFIEAGFHLSGCLIWKKNALVLGRSPYQWIHEPCLFGFKKGAAHRFYGGRKEVTVTEYGEPFVKREDGSYALELGGQTLVLNGNVKVEALEQSVLYFDKPKRSADHPTMKPTGLLIKHLKNSARANDIVVDAFGGSGSTMIAAEMLGMCARMMELDAKFIDVQCQRYFDYTGRVPVHAVTGEPFPVKRDNLS